MYYAEYGDPNKPIILFLHGGGVSGWMWDKQIPFFEDYYCIVPDLPGHGRSSSLNFTIRGSSERLIELLLEKANGQKVIVVGFSLGAQIAVQMLGLRPDLIDYAVINSALVRPMPYASKIIGLMVRLSMPLTRLRPFARLQAKSLYINEDYFEQYYKESSEMKAETLTSILRENMSFTIPDSYAKASGKILVTVGEKEKAVMRKSARELAAVGSNSKAVLIPYMGHGISLAEPDWFNRMVKAWISMDTVPIDCKIIR